MHGKNYTYGHQVTATFSNYTVYSVKFTVTITLTAIKSTQLSVITLRIQ